MIVLLIIIGLPIFLYWYFKRKYGVYLKGKSGKVYIGFARTSAFGDTYCHYGHITDRNTVTLDKDGKIKAHASSYNAEAITEWKWCNPKGK